MGKNENSFLLLKSAWFIYTYKRYNNDNIRKNKYDTFVIQKIY